MFKYLKSRGKQPTTWIGLAAAAMSLASTGGTLNPDVVSSLLVAAGLIHVNEERK